MKILGQLFVRENDALSKNTYLVCGIIRTDKPLEGESVHTFGGNIEVALVENREAEGKGNSLDGIVRTPIWRLR